MRQTITVSRQIGTDGNAVASKVASHLGFRYFDKELIAKEAKRLGLNINEAIACDITEDDYEPVSFLESEFGNRDLFCLVQTTPFGSVERLRTVNEKSCISMESKIITNLAMQGGIVIVGRGGQALLQNYPNTLHVKLFAPQSYRLKRIVEVEGMSLRDAGTYLWKRDRATEQYLRRFRRLDWNNDTVYGLVIDMSKSSIDAAASLIADYALSEQGEIMGGWVRSNQ